jgi:hypothetical protein
MWFPRLFFIAFLIFLLGGCSKSVEYTYKTSDDVIISNLYKNLNIFLEVLPQDSFYQGNSNIKKGPYQIRIAIEGTGLENVRRIILNKILLKYNMSEINIRGRILNIYRSNTKNYFSSLELEKFINDGILEFHGDINDRVVLTAGTFDIDYKNVKQIQIGFDITIFLFEDDTINLKQNFSLKRSRVLKPIIPTA